MTYNCPDCGKTFEHSGLLYKHLVRRHGWDLEAAYEHGCQLIYPEEYQRDDMGRLWRVAPVPVSCETQL